jgi:hypothetical protein
MIGEVEKAKRQRGVTLFGLLFWAIVVGFVALIGMRVLPTLNEYFTIKRTVNKIAGEGSTVAEIRSAFEKQKDIEYSIVSITGKDLTITKENDKVVVSFAYDKEVELVKPVFLLISSRAGRTNRAARLRSEPFLTHGFPPRRLQRARPPLQRSGAPRTGPHAPQLRRRPQRAPRIPRRRRSQPRRLEPPVRAPRRF